MLFTRETAGKAHEFVCDFFGLMRDADKHLVDCILHNDFDWFTLSLRDIDMSMSIWFRGNRSILMHKILDTAGFDVPPPKVLVQEKWRSGNKDYVWSFEENKPNMRYDDVFNAFLNSTFKALTQYKIRNNHGRVIQKIDTPAQADPIAH